MFEQLFVSALSICAVILTVVNLLLSLRNKFVLFLFNYHAAVLGLESSTNCNMIFSMKINFSHIVSCCISEYKQIMSSIATIDIIMHFGIKHKHCISINIVYLVKPIFTNTCVYFVLQCIFMIGKNT